MKKIDTVRALRDAEYRHSLSADELAQLPAHPAGVSVVADEDLKSVTGGCGYTQCSNCIPFSLGSCMPPGVICP